MQNAAAPAAATDVPTTQDGDGVKHSAVEPAALPSDAAAEPCTHNALSS